MQPVADFPETGIDELHAAWCDAIRNADLDGALGLLTPDYVLWAAGSPPIVGRESVRRILAVAFASYHIEPAFESSERIVSGDLAVERGWDVQTIEPQEGGPSRIQRQRVFVVLRRGADGRWRFARGMSQPGPEAG